MDIFTTFSIRLLALTFATAILMAGCNNPASNDDDDHEEHSEPHAIQFAMNGETIVTYPAGENSGHFDVEEDHETSLITAEFLDENGNEIHGEDLDDEYSLAWEIADTDIADIEQHDEDGRWSFHIVGKTAGGTTVKFMLMHGDHADFETPDLDDDNPLQIHVGEHSH
jgi:hypothetical protein